VRIVDGVFLVNGKAVKFKGVNRHENFPQTAHALTRADMELDMKRLKQANVNHVRLSHYPNDPYWYYLCDKYGMYLVERGEHRVTRLLLWQGIALAPEGVGGRARRPHHGHGRARQKPPVRHHLVARQRGGPGQKLRRRQRGDHGSSRATAP
jgi:beta-galactosidase